MKVKTSWVCPLDALKIHVDEVRHRELSKDGLGVLLEKPYKQVCCVLSGDHGGDHMNFRQSHVAFEGCNQHHNSFVGSFPAKEFVGAF